MKLTKWFLILGISAELLIFAPAIKENLSDKLRISQIKQESKDEESKGVRKQEKVKPNEDVEKGLTQAVDKGIDYLKEKEISEEKKATESAESSFNSVKEFYRKMKDSDHGCFYIETMDVLNEAEVYLKNAENCLYKDAEKSSKYSELAEKEFLKVYNITTKIDSYWSNLNEKLKRLDLKYRTIPSVVAKCEEQNELFDKANKLYYEAVNILRHGTLPQGGYSSEKNLKIGEEKINEAFGYVEKAEKIYLDSLKE